MDIKIYGNKKVIIGFIVASIVLVLLSILTGDRGVIGNVIIIALFMSSVPIFVYRYTRFVWIRALEEQFPNFVRDLADANRSGMSLPEAIKIVSKSNYGKLSPEIKKMSNRLSWGTPFLRTLEIFGKSIQDSKTINEALNIIKESYESGGNVSSTLKAVARDMTILKDAEAERESLIKQQVFIMYGVFFMFLSISVMIIQVMVPMVRTQPDIQAGSFGLQFRDPCTNFAPFPCSLYSFIGTMLNVSSGIGQYYTALFFMVVVIQGIFTGLIAGQLGENSVVAGGKHAFIMTAVGIGVFIFLARLGLLPS